MTKKVTPLLQEGRTAFYEAIVDDRLEYRKSLTDAMRWFRPVDRLLKQHIVKGIDGFLQRLEPILQESRADDEALAAMQRPTVEFVEPSLDYDATTQTNIVVEHN